MSFFGNKINPVIRTQQEQIDKAFKAQYDASLVVASHFDLHGTALNETLKSKIEFLENSILEFKNLSDKYQDTNACVMFNHKIITRIQAFATISNFVVAIRRESKYIFTKLLI